MGNTKSKPLAEWSAQDVANGVVSLGKRYEGYREEIEENGVDGKFLLSVAKGPEGVQETLEDLAITNRLHGRKIQLEFEELIREDDCKKKQQQQQCENLPQNQQSENSVPPAVHVIRRSSQKKRRSSLLQAAKAYEYHVLPEESAPEPLGLPQDDDDLMPFDDLAAKLYNQLERKHKKPPAYVGVHLFHGDCGGHVALGSRFINPETQNLDKKRRHVERGSLCYKLFAASDDDMDQNEVAGYSKVDDGVDDRDFATVIVPPGTFELQEPGRSSFYSGHVITNEDGESVGVVCSVVDADDEDNQASFGSLPSLEDKEEQKELLQQLALESEQLLNARKALLERNKLVKGQVQDLQKVMISDESGADASTADDTSRGDNGAVDLHLPPISDDQVAKRQKESWIPPTTIEIPNRRTMSIPLVKELRATEEEVNNFSHLPADVFEANDRLGVDRAPIPKNDLERVAALEHLGLKDLEPDHPLWVSLKGLVEVAATLLGSKIGLVTYLDQSSAFATCAYIAADVPEPTLGFISDHYAPYKLDPKTGTPYMQKGPRCIAQCNLPTATKRTFMCPDLWNDESYPHSKDAPGALRFYIGTPILWRTLPVATLCLLDPDVKYDAGPLQELQIEQIAGIMSQQIENYSIQLETERLEDQRKRLREMQSSTKSDNTKPPEGHIALVSTDIQGSTRLWEASPTAMSKALKIHDNIMRKHLSANFGFEITTEGDAFQIAFHDSIDALRFCLAVQEDLQKANWNEDFLKLPDGKDDGRGCRGARVRMAIHCGNASHRENAVSGRQEYYGDTMYITKSLEDMAHGGQILVTSEIWKAVSYVAETTLGAPQVVDLGEHVVYKGKKKDEGVISMGVVQVVPSSLAYDFFTHRTLGADASGAYGRLFDEPETQKQLSPSFFDAPYLNDQATMLFIYTSEVEKRFEDPPAILAVLAQLAGNLVGVGPGYQCKSWMFAFPSPDDAVDYAISLQEMLLERPVHGESLGGMIKIGIHEGEYTSMGPHRTTGRADYYGKVVNRAARVAGAAQPGDVCLGRLDKEGPTICDGEVECIYLGAKLLSGMEEEMNLYSCRRVQEKQSVWHPSAPASQDDGKNAPEYLVGASFWIN